MAAREAGDAPEGAGPTIVNPADLPRRKQLAEARGRTEEALVAYREAIRIQPRLIEAQTRLAGVLVRAGRLRDALDRLQAVVELDPVHQPRA